jgi:hypothetical protein
MRVSSDLLEVVPVSARSPSPSLFVPKPGADDNDERRYMPDCDGRSVNVSLRPYLALALVTHFVTRTAGRARVSALLNHQLFLH